MVEGMHGDLHVIVSVLDEFLIRGLGSSPGDLAGNVVLCKYVAQEDNTMT